MTAEQINEVLKQRDPEWIRSFMELAKQYEGANLNTEKWLWNY